MRHSPRAKALIEKSENFEAHAYPDPASDMGRGLYPKDGPDVSRGAPWTIGFGETGPDIHRGLVWTLDTAEKRLDLRLIGLDEAVTGVLAGAPTTQNQFDALVSFAYNEGIGKLRNSTLFTKHKAGDYAGAKAEFAKWKYANGVVFKGLVTRRAAEAALYALA